MTSVYDNTSSIVVYSKLIISDIPIEVASVPMLIRALKNDFDLASFAEAMLMLKTCSDANILCKIEPDWHLFDDYNYNELMLALTKAYTCSSQTYKPYYANMIRYYNTDFEDSDQLEWLDIVRTNSKIKNLIIESGCIKLDDGSYFNKLTNHDAEFYRYNSTMYIIKVNNFVYVPCRYTWSIKPLMRTTDEFKVTFMYEAAIIADSVGVCIYNFDTELILYQGKHTGMFITGTFDYLLYKLDNIYVLYDINHGTSKKFEIDLSESVIYANFIIYIEDTKIVMFNIVTNRAIDTCHMQISSLKLKLVNKTLICYNDQRLIMISLSSKRLKIIFTININITDIDTSKNMFVINKKICYNTNKRKFIDTEYVNLVFA
jgi:hypothetical protein